MDGNRIYDMESISNNTKLCKKCGKVKQMSEFFRMTSSKDGLKPSCIRDVIVGRYWGDVQ